MTATGSNARSTLVVQLSPTRSAKLSFSVLITLALLWLGWAAYLLMSDRANGSQGYLYYVFFGLAVLFLGYVVLQNTSVFGIQSYIELTPQYIVQKYGVFRTKHIVSIPEVKEVRLVPDAMHIIKRDGTGVLLNLKQVRKKRDLDKIESKIREMAATHSYTVTEATGENI